MMILSHWPKKEHSQMSYKENGGKKDHYSDSIFFPVINSHEYAAK